MEGKPFRLVYGHDSYAVSFRRWYCGTFNPLVPHFEEMLYRRRIAVGEKIHDFIEETRQECRLPLCFGLSA